MAGASMREFSQRTVRILFDVQACQTAGSAQRGVGRYSHALLSAIAATAEPREIYALGASHHALPLMPDCLPVHRQLVVGPLPEWETERDFEGGGHDTLDAMTLSAVVSGINPDIVHISHVFEGYSDRVALPISSGRPVGQLLSATLYDIIPLRFSDHYFKDSRFKLWYLQRLKWLRQADLLLSISESSRQDAIDLLGIDGSRIVTIHGGISGHFKPLADAAAGRERLSATYGINRQHFVLYTAGDDHRKNLQGAIAGYAALPLDMRRRTQLVIVCAIEPHRKAMYLDLGRKLGVLESDLLFVGFVPEDDLVAFYATCDVFIFPSLYEGLGLPVLEAMACGAPVVAGNNSSIPELMPDAEALFDAAQPEAIAQCIHRVLANAAFAGRLRNDGLTRSRQFTWERSASIALEAFDAALQRKREAGTRAAQSGWLGRQRMAMFTPLPPCRSGIADYNAQFLPYLAEHFDIDLYVDGYKVSDDAINAAYRIFDAKDFRASAAAYDVILYELGNSEFHVHMLPLLAEFPGVVGLHDAFLSGMMGYLEFNLGEKDRYTREMLAAHHGRARRLFAPIAEHPDAIGTSMVELPCTKRVLDHAIGVISHSPFNLKIAREFYPEGWPAPYRIIPQMVTVPEPLAPERVRQTRVDLGFASDDFIVATFGHVAWTKCGDRLLEAFLASELATDVRCHIVFAGELAKDDFGVALDQRICKSGLHNRIKITGFLSEVDYARYLRIADVAVQLRTKSRGGTPKGVLDCLANGVPVVVNNEASYEDYPDQVMLKLPPDPATADIVDALVTLRTEPDQRRAIAERGRAYVREHHDPKHCAAQYAAAIAEFTSRHAATRSESRAAGLAPDLAGCPRPMHAAELAANFLAGCSGPRFDRRRLVIDVSHIAKDDHGTGIPRVVRETVRAAYRSERPGLSVVAAELACSELVEAKSWLARQQLLMRFEMNEARPTPLTLLPGDHLLMLDSSWARYAEFEPVFARARAARVPITTAVYDLLPMTLPAGNTVSGGKEWFEGWLRSAIKASDGLVCISKAMADELVGYVMRNGLGRKGLKVGYWHLGANVAVSLDCPADSPVRRVSEPYLLMVGTIEPRKNHALVLDAFEQLWRKGCDLSLVIAGRPGWMVDELLKQLRHHKLRNKKLHLFEDVVDTEIAYLYRHASALLFPSKGEGFGLPLVEAAQYGTPIICSDIPVFHEIAGDHAAYVLIENPDQLATEIADWWDHAKVGEATGSSGMARLNWEQSTDGLICVVLRQKWYWEL